METPLHTRAQGQGDAGSENVPRCIAVSLSFMTIPSGPLPTRRHPREENPVGHGQLRPPTALNFMEVMAAMYRQDLLLMRRVFCDGDSAKKSVQKNAG
eukprot:s764_g7.t1